MADILPTQQDKLQTADEQPKRPQNTLWLSVSETAKISGVNNKTIRRAIQSKTVRYKVINNRYFIDFASVVIYLNSSLKLKNKFNQYGIGQLVDKWL